MKRYKGYYIDGAIFNSEKEIDNFIKAEVIKKIKVFNNMLLSDRYNRNEKHAICGEITLREERLHDEFNMSWEEIELVAFQ